MEMIYSLYAEAEEKAKIKKQRFAVGGTFFSSGGIMGLITSSASMSEGSVWLTITDAVLGLVTGTK